MNGSADSAAYSFALGRARDADEANGWAVTMKSPEALAGCTLILSRNGGCGVAVTPTGDIVALFNNKAVSGIKGVAKVLIPTAIANGGTKLDCYGPALARIYAKFGFIPVARVAFNAEYANEGWTPAKGTPDIYFMVHNGDSADVVVEKERLAEKLADGVDQTGGHQTYGDVDLTVPEDPAPCLMSTWAHSSERGKRDISRRRSRKASGWK